MASVAFLGPGKMGTGMALRLLAAGHALRVFARSAAKAAPLLEAGAVACASPRAACDGADAVFAMVSDDAASRAVWLGADGALAGQLAPGALAIECSTLSRGWVLELAAAAAARGLRYVDAPVTGMLAGDHEREVAFTPALRAKDVDYALRLARELAIGSPFGALAAQRFEQLRAQHPGEINESKVIDLARSLAPEPARSRA